MIADKLNWVAIDNLREPMEAKVKIRYGAREAAATLYPQEDGKVKVEFREPARAITPGQSAVFILTSGYWEAALLRAVFNYTVLCCKG